MGARVWIGAVLGLVSLALCAAWLARGGESGRAARPAVDAPSARWTRDAPSIVAVPRSGPQRAPAAIPERSALAEDASAAGHPTWIVRGRVLDVRGHAIEGAAIELHAAGVAEGLHAEPPPETLATISDRDGRFELAAPVLASSWIALAVRPDDFHGRTWRHFGFGAPGGDLLRSGVNDVGDLVLVDAGAIEGTLRGVDGEPVAGAAVFLEGSSDVPGGKSDAQGRFRVAHVPAGEYSVQAIAEGYLIARHEPVLVRDRETAAGVDLVLERGPTITGRVEDDQGLGLSGARLWGWPASGRGASARSAADGTFVVHLPQDEPYTLAAELEGYANYDPGRGVVHAPGTRDLLIVMRRSALVTFRVVDPDGAPVERFGLKVIQVRTADGWTWSSSEHAQPAPIELHPDGEVTLGADPALHEVTVVAPGFGARRVPIAPDAGDGRGQTIVLEREAVLRGRLVQEGVPVPLPAVRVQRAAPASATDAGELMLDEFDLDELAGRARDELGGLDGAFRVGDLAAGTYTITLSAPDVAPIHIERVHVEAGLERDLGDVATHAPGELSGVVLLPSGLSAEGLVLALGDQDFGDAQRSRTLGTDGAFRFGGLGAGSQYVHVEAKPGIVLSGAPFRFDLAPGEHRAVQIDLTPRVPARVEVRVVLGGEPAAGVRVDAIHADREGWRAQMHVGTTNAQGTCVADLPPHAPATLLAISEHGVELARSAEITTPGPAGTLATVIAGAAPGRLAAAFAGAIPEPIAILQIFALDADGVAGRRSTQAIPPARWEGDAPRRVDLGPLPPGAYRLEMRGADGELQAGTATVVSAAETTCELAPSPR